jgi:hypothetical protein
MRLPPSNSVRYRWRALGQNLRNQRLKNLQLPRLPSPLAAPYRRLSEKIATLYCALGNKVFWPALRVVFSQAWPPLFKVVFSFWRTVRLS